YLAEYNSLRGEIQIRLQSQSQAFNYLVTLLAATVGGITYLAKEDRVDLIPQLGLFLPIVIAPLAYIFFDNEFMIFRNGFYGRIPVFPVKGKTPVVTKLPHR